MPPLPNTAQVIQFDMVYGMGADENIINRLHWQYTGGAPSAADMATLCGDVAASYSAHLAALVNANGLLRKVDGIDLTSNTAAVGSFAANAAGTRTGAQLPVGVALLINHKIARRYRGGKPRTYAPFFSGSDFPGGGAWSAGSVTAAQTAWNAFLAGVTGSTAGTTVLATFGCVSYFQNKVLRTAGLFEAISASSVNNLPASQRRRNGH